MVPDRFAPVLAQLAPLAERFAAAGHRLYLVGGTVRDLMVDAASDDFDIDLTTDARPPDIKSALDGWADAVWTQGERFGTIGAKHAGRTYEITTFRAESYSDESRKPHVTYADEIDVDLGRRDFTVNAMALELTGGDTPTLVDPHGGAVDLMQQTLRTPLGPEISFSDDPLRMLRAARFISRYDLKPTEQLVTAVEQMANRMEIVSAERIRDELDKLLAASHPSRGMRFLADIDAMPFVISGLAGADLAEIGLELDTADRDVELRRLILFQAVPAADRVTDISALRYSNHERKTMRLVLAALDDVRAQENWSDEEIRRLVDQVGSSRVELLFSLCRTVDGVTGAEAAYRLLAEREDLSDIGPVLGGDEVMAALGLTEGRQVGFVLDALRERRLREGPATRDEELGFIAGLDVSN